MEDFLNDNVPFWYDITAMSFQFYHFIAPFDKKAKHQNYFDVSFYLLQNDINCRRHDVTLSIERVKIWWRQKSGDKIISKCARMPVYGSVFERD